MEDPDAIEYYADEDSSGPSRPTAVVRRNKMEDPDAIEYYADEDSSGPSRPTTVVRRNKMEDPDAIEYAGEDWSGSSTSPEDTSRNEMEDADAMEYADEDSSGSWNSSNLVGSDETLVFYPEGVSSESSMSINECLSEESDSEGITFVAGSDTIEEEEVPFVGIYRPPYRSMRERIRLFLHNSQEGTVLGRTASGWGK